MEKPPPKRSDFAGLTALSSLSISGNTFIFGGLKTLPADLFQGLPALRSLSLSNNQLRTLPIGIFEGLSLTGLTLTGNPWVSFPTNIFEELVGDNQGTRNHVMGLAPINAALPVTNGTIPAQSLARTANPLTLEVATFFSDPGDTLTYTATSAAPAIASVAISGSTLTITPVALGTTNIMVTARDTAGQPVTQTFAVTVGGDAAAVAAPIISINPATLIATVGTAIETITITNTGGDVVSHIITDSDGQSASLNDFTQQAGLVFNTATGIISGTLNDSVEIGTETYIITATNSGGSDSATITITVNDVPPIISINPATLIATVGTPIDTITITNTGGDVVSHIITDSNGQEVTDLAGLVVDAEAGIITGTLNADADIGTAVYTITVINSGGSDSATVTISVKNVNDVNEAPTTVGTIADITNLVANGNSQTVDVAGKFNDTDALTFSATSNNPNIASVSGSTTITITPVAVGTTTITVTATDTANQTVTQTFVVSVSNPAVVPNPAPTTVGTIADITNLVANGNSQTVDVAGKFNDTDALTFSAMSNNPNIASVSGSTTITITPLAAGTTTITVTATDTANQTVTQTFVVSVSNPAVVPNLAPTTVGT